MLHVFFDCHYDVPCWHKVDYQVDARLTESALMWLLEKLSNESNKNTVLWGVWFARNKKVWENKQLTPAVIVEMSYKQIIEWQEALKRGQTHAFSKSRNCYFISLCKVGSSRSRLFETEC